MAATPVLKILVVIALLFVALQLAKGTCWGKKSWGKKKWGGGSKWGGSDYESDSDDEYTSDYEEDMEEDETEDEDDTPEDEESEYSDMEEDMEEDAEDDYEEDAENDYEEDAENDYEEDAEEDAEDDYEADLAPEATMGGSQGMMGVATDLLPKGMAGGRQDFGEFAPKSLMGQNFLDAKKYIGVDTQGSSLRNANYDLRSSPTIPRRDIGPWAQSTIEGEMMRKPLE